MRRKKLPEEPKEINTIVVRIHKETHARMKAIKGKQHFTDFLSAAIDTIEMLATHTPVYLVGDRVFEDLPTARGEAIQEAARGNKSSWDLPYIAVVLGQDAGN